MRTPGKDITNKSQNNNSGNNDEDESNNSRREFIISRLEQNGAKPVAKAAGKGIIRVVSRCENAKENNSLGKKSNQVTNNTLNLKYCGKGKIHNSFVVIM